MKVKKAQQEYVAILNRRESVHPPDSFYIRSDERMLHQYLNTPGKIDNLVH
jgi:hypothetical protein